MPQNYQNTSAFIISTFLGIIIYTGLFLYLLGIKFIRHAADSQGNELWLLAEVELGTIALVITLTAIFFIFFDRTLSGRFFFIAAILGTFLIALTTAGIIGPFWVAIGLGKYVWIGLISGITIIVISNISSFFLKIPSLL